MRHRPIMVLYQSILDIINLMKAFIELSFETNILIFCILHGVICTKRSLLFSVGTDDPIKLCVKG